MATKERIVKILQCRDCKGKNYSVAKGKKGVQKPKLELRKFCATCGHHTAHKETKSS